MRRSAAWIAAAIAGAAALCPDVRRAVHELAAGPAGVVPAGTVSVAARAAESRTEAASGATDARVRGQASPSLDASDAAVGSNLTARRRPPGSASPVGFRVEGQTDETSPDADGIDPRPTEAKTSSPARARVSALSREDEAYRSKYGYAAYNELLRERHRSEMAAAGALPVPSVASGTPNQAVSEPTVDPLPAVGNMVPAGSPQPTSAAAGNANVPAVSVGAEVPSDSGMEPASSGIPRELIPSPTLRLRSIGGVRVIESGPLVGSVWRLERADSLENPSWKDAGAFDHQRPFVVPGGTAPSGFWRIRGGGR